MFYETMAAEYLTEADRKVLASAGWEIIADCHDVVAWNRAAGHELYFNFAGEGGWLHSESEDEVFATVAEALQALDACG